MKSPIVLTAIAPTRSHHAATSSNAVRPAATPDRRGGVRARLRAAMGLVD